MAAPKDVSVLEFEKKLANNPSSMVFSRLADCYRKRGDIQQAIDVCARGLTDHPDSLTGRIILGRCFLEQEKLSEATQEFSNVIEHDHRNQVAIKMLADVYARQGMKEKAGDLYGYLCAMDPGSETLFNLTKTYAGTGKTNIHEILGFSAPSPAASMAGAEPEAAGGDIFTDDSNTADAALPMQDGGAFERTMKFEAEELLPGSADSAGADFARTMKYDPQELNEGASSAYEVEEVVEDIARGNDGAVTGDDISKRMSMMFDDESSPIENGDAAPEAETISPAQPIHETASFAAPIDTSPLHGPLPEVSGSDVSSRIEELFSVKPEQRPSGQDGDYTQLFDTPQSVSQGVQQTPYEMPKDHDVPRIQNAGVEEGRHASDVSGEDIISRMNEMFEQTDSVEAPASKQRPELELIKTVDNAADISAMTDEAASLPVSGPDQTEGGISGDDIAQRLETIFDEEPIAMRHTVQTDDTMAMDTMFSGQPGADEAAATVQIEGEEPIRQDGFTVSESSDEIDSSGKKQVGDEETFMAVDATMAAEATVVEEQRVDSRDSGAPTLEIPLSDTLEFDVAARFDSPAQQAQTPTPQLEDTVPPDDTPEMSGNDVLTRLDELFPQSLSGDDSVSMVDEIPEGEKEEETVSQGFYTMSGDNAETAKPEESLLEKLDDVEFETPLRPPVDNDIFADSSGADLSVPAAFLHGSKPSTDKDIDRLPAPGDAAGAADIEDDKEETPEEEARSGELSAQAYSIPDHVLTPTLADIYFQQGQPQLAVEIYQRLLLKNPDNERIVRRIADIRRHIALAGEQQLAEKQKSAVKPVFAPAPPPRAKKSSATPKPLAGVRIKKSVKKKAKER